MVEATGVFATHAACSKHLEAGAKKVLLTVPPKDHADAMIVMGVNQETLKATDLIISNGVIHHTPDSRSSFRELARILKPGGTLVVSVYDRDGWYYWVWRYPGALIRSLRRLVGDVGLKYSVFPLFHVGVLALLSLQTRRVFRLPIASSWNLFHDQFTTPQCEFHSFDEVAGWGDEIALQPVERRREAANQLATLRFRRPLESECATATGNEVLSSG